MKKPKPNIKPKAKAKPHSWEPSWRHEPGGKAKFPSPFTKLGSIKQKFKKQEEKSEKKV